jgi:hypothetical protein
MNVLFRFVKMLPREALSGSVFILHQVEARLRWPEHVHVACLPENLECERPICLTHVLYCIGFGAGCIRIWLILGCLVRAWRLNVARTSKCVKGRGSIDLSKPDFFRQAKTKCFGGHIWVPCTVIKACVALLA